MAEADRDFAPIFLRIDDDIITLGWDSDIACLAYCIRCSGGGEKSGRVGCVEELAHFLDEASMPSELAFSFGGDHSTPPDWSPMPTWGQRPDDATHPSDCEAEMVSWDKISILWHRLQSGIHVLEALPRRATGVGGPIGDVPT
jgi:hypothetical protein